LPKLPEFPGVCHGYRLAFDLRSKEAFVPALAPGSFDHFSYNEHYGTDEEFVYALANAMRDKYRVIVDAGFILQIDDPCIATSWDMMKPEPSLATTEIRDLADPGAERCHHRHLAGESALPPVRKYRASCADIGREPARGCFAALANANTRLD
jgi:hypothetical protein